MKLLEIIQREDGAVSMVRVMACIMFIFYVVLYTVAFITGKQLPYFSEFSAFTASVIFSTLGSKYLDIKQQINLGGK